MGLEPEMFSLKALLPGVLHCLHVCDFFNPLLPQGMDIETLRRVGATLCVRPWGTLGKGVDRGLRSPIHVPVRRELVWI